MIGKFQLYFSQKGKRIDIIHSKSIMRFLVNKKVPGNYTVEMYADNWLKRPIIGHNYYLSNTTYWTPEFVRYDTIKNL